MPSSETSGDSLVSSRWWNSSGPPGLPGRSSGRSGIFGELPAKHRASRCALEARRMAIAVADELQESVGPGSEGSVWQVGVLPANHRASRCALECCLEGFAALDGHKSMPSRERRCPGGP